MEHEITRHRHELRRWDVTVQAKEYVTPNMLRLTFHGADLAQFTSLGADDHVKLLVPGKNGEMERRDYTPRAFDRDACTLTVDFAVHDAGPATQWAIDVQPGDAAHLGGPRGSMVVPTSFDWWLLVADETGLPAMGRRLGELPPGTRVFTVGLVTSADEEQHFATAADHTAIWVHRPARTADDPAPGLAAVTGLVLPAGDGYVWIAAEARVSRSIRDHFLAAGHPREWLKASGYWLKGTADSHDNMG